VNLGDFSNFYARAVRVPAPKTQQPVPRAKARQAAATFSSKQTFWIDPRFFIIPITPHETVITAWNSAPSQTENRKS
jgi:hypothetical protein